MNETINKRLDSLEYTIAQVNSAGQASCAADSSGSFLNPAHNCSHILHQHPLATSGKAIHSYSKKIQILVDTGYYWLQSSPGYAVKVYCDMERVCGCGEGSGEGGGWMRVADIST